MSLLNSNNSHNKNKKNYKQINLKKIENVTINNIYN